MVRIAGVAVGGGVLLIVAAVEIRLPAPFFRRHDLGAGVHRLHLCRHRDDVGLVFGGVRADGVDVTMGGEPDAGFIAHQVVFHAARAGVAERLDDMLDPGLFGGGAVGDVGIQRIVAGDGRVAVGVETVAGVGVVRIHRALRAVFGDREARQDASVGAERGHVADQRYGYGLCGARTSCLRDEAVPRCRSRPRRLADSFRSSSRCPGSAR